MSARKAFSRANPVMRILLTLCLLFAAGAGHAIERVTYYHNDALGSPVAATDGNGTLLWRESYAPYGERLTHEAGSKDTVWYTGKQEEEAFGLNYFGARWYEPRIGRFMGVDPAGFSADNTQSFNKYAYANNNPYLYVDPDGRSSRKEEFAALGEPDPDAPLANAAATVAQGASDLADAVDAQVTDPINYVPLGALGIVKNVAKGTAGGTRAGKSFTRKGKAEIDAANADRHGGVNVCENCGTEVVPGQRSQRGVSPPGNERQRDHITPKSKGGDGDPPNGQILCRNCNLNKSDKL